MAKSCGGEVSGGKGGIGSRTRSEQVNTEKNMLQKRPVGNVTEGTEETGKIEGVEAEQQFSLVRVETILDDCLTVQTPIDGMDQRGDQPAMSIVGLEQKHISVDQKVEDRMLIEHDYMKDRKSQGKEGQDENDRGYVQNKTPTTHQPLSECTNIMKLKCSKVEGDSKIHTKGQWKKLARMIGQGDKSQNLDSQEGQNTGPGTNECGRKTLDC